MTLPTRTLGSSGLTVSMQGLGCMGMSQSYGTADPDEARATIDRALELGVTFLDTADVYGDGHNETFVGKAIAGRRDQVVLATKFSLSRDDGSMRINGRPEYVRLGHRRQPGPARDRLRRPVLPAPGRPERPDRGHRRRDG